MTLVSESQRTQVRTGIPMIDAGLNGGPFPGSVNAILGPTGSGRTRLAMMVAAEQGVQALRDHYADLPARRAFVAVSSEEPRDMHRYMATYLADAPIESIHAKIRGVPEEEFVSAIRRFVADRSNANPLDRAIGSWAAAHRGAVVFKPRDALVPGQGTPADCCLLTPGMEDGVGCLVIDDLTLLVDSFGDGQPNYFAVAQYRAALDRLREYAKARQTTVWIVHTLAARLWDAPPDALYKHTQTAYYRRFSEHLDSCFILGNQDRLNRFRVQCTLRHRQPAECNLVAKFNDLGTAIVPADGEGILTPARGRRRTVGMAVETDPGVIAAARDREAQTRRALDELRVIEIDPSPPRRDDAGG